MSDLPSHGDLSYAPPSPVDPAAGDPTAVMGRRILAWVLDLLLFLAVVIGVFAALAERVPLNGFDGDACARLQELSPDRAITCVDLSDVGVDTWNDYVFVTSDGDAAIQTLATFGYFAAFVLIQGITGGSPGKLLTGLRVVDEQGRTAGIGRSIVRTLLWAIDGAPWFVPLVGFITGLTSTGHRRVGDLAAGTWVVSKGAVGSPPAKSTPSFDPTAPASWTPPPAAPTTWSTPQPTWEPPSAEPDPARVDAIVSAAEPDPVPSAEPADPADTPEPTGIGADPSWDWEPPTTPGDDFGTVAADSSPTAGPTPLVAPGSEAPPPTGPRSADEAEPAELPPPQWDQARGTYIQWDPRQHAWLQWDTVGQRWKPIDT